ncbi:MAG: AAA family ATPase [Anaerolineales bacterium]
MTQPLHEITIHQLRGIKNLTLSDLGSVNILVGANNSGKTSVLEALATYARPLDIYEWISTAWRREVNASRRSTVETLKWLFPQNKTSEDEVYHGQTFVSGKGKFAVEEVHAEFEDVFRIPQSKNHESLDDVDEGEQEHGAKLTVRIETMQSSHTVVQSFEIWDTQNKPYPKANKPALPVVTITPVTHRTEQLSGISDLIKTKNKADVLEALRMFDKGVRDIVILTPQGMRSTLEIDHADFSTTAPVSAFGDGMRRALTFAMTLPKVKGGLLLVDEIETAIHVSALQELYSWLVKVCKQNDTQLFVTTHSLEAVDALLGAHSAPYDGLVAYRLGQAGIQTKRFSGEMLGRLRDEHGLDVR